MKSIKFCLLIAALCCMVPAVAQKTFGSVKYTAMCSYYGETITGDIVAYEANATAQNVVKDIMSVIGLKPNFELRAANVPNAAAVMLNNKRFILYNPSYMNKINSTSGTYWAAISILAHEIGHHLNGHTLDNVGSRPQTELDADEFSGFVLRKMGASLEDAQAVMSIIASLKGSHTHPPKNDRLTYIARGWNNAGNNKETAVAQAATPQPAIQKQMAQPKPQAAVNKQTTVPQTVAQRPVQRPTPQPKQTTVATANPRTKKIAESTASKQIASDAYFESDPNGRYYLTTKGNLVQVENDKVYLIGSLTASDRNGYKFMVADNDTNSIYIGQGGTLVNASGKQVGYLKARK